MCVYIYIYICICKSLSLSLYIYIYIYITYMEALKTMVAQTAVMGIMFYE